MSSAVMPATLMPFIETLPYALFMFAIVSPTTRAITRRTTMMPTVATLLERTRSLTASNTEADGACLADWERDDAVYARERDEAALLLVWAFDERRLLREDELAFEPVGAAA